MKKKQILLIVGAIVVCALCFYGGIKYGEWKAGTAAGGPQSFLNLSPEERQARMQQFGGQDGVARRVGSGGGFVNGEILRKDATSITIQLREGGSRIVFLASSTQVMKSTNGTMDDLAVGTEVTALGSSNSDGSITAQTIQLRPAGSPMGGGEPR